MPPFAIAPRAAWEEGVGGMGRGLIYLERIVIGGDGVHYHRRAAPSLSTADADAAVVGVVVF